VSSWGLLLKEEFWVNTEADLPERVRFGLCPCCEKQADPVDDRNDGWYYRHQKYRCWGCDFSWDINEDFICGTCRKPVPGRILYCSDECTKEWD